MPQEKPICQALVICDQIITDAATGKKTLVGIFNNLGAAQFPCVHPRFCVYVSLTNGLGENAVELRLVREGVTEPPIAQAKGKIKFGAPTEMLELNFEFINVKFPEPGLHTIEIHCDDELLTERRFTVVKVQPAPQSPPKSEM